VFLSVRFFFARRIAFVRYLTPESARAAIEKMNGMVVAGCTLRTAQANPSQRTSSFSSRPGPQYSTPHSSYRDDERPYFPGPQTPQREDD